MAIVWKQIFSICTHLLSILTQTWKLLKSHSILSHTATNSVWNYSAVKRDNTVNTSISIRRATLWNWCFCFYCISLLKTPIHDTETAETIVEGWRRSCISLFFSWKKKRRRWIWASGCLREPFKTEKGVLVILMGLRSVKHMNNGT